MQVIDFQMKKAPLQERSKQTVRAIIQATAQILEQDGFSALNTNQIAELAGVSIGSIYEYFPGKEAIVAALVDQQVEECLGILDKSIGLQVNNELQVILRSSLDIIYQFVSKKRKLFIALLFQTPFVYQIPSIQKLQEDIFRTAIEGNSHLKESRKVIHNTENRYMLASATAGVVLYLALMPEQGINADKVLDEFSATLHSWIKE